MKKKKNMRIASAIMTLALLITLMPFSAVTVKADEGLCQIGSIVYGTWGEAISAVQTGQTITLLQNVTLEQSDNMPEVACDIDGGGHTLSLCRDIDVNANIKLKDLYFSGSYQFNCTNSANSYEANVTIDGTVSGLTSNDKVGFMSGNSLVVNGSLSCNFAIMFNTLTVNSNALLTVDQYVGVKNAKINGTVIVNKDYFGLSNSSGTGILSGSGTIDFKRQNPDGYNMILSHARVDEDCRITLTADYEPVENGQLIRNSSSDSPVVNIDRLTLGNGYSCFKLVTSADSSGYYYTLKAATKTALTQPVITLAANSTSGGLNYAISDSPSGEVSGISCYRIKLCDSNGTSQVGSSIYTDSTTGSIPLSAQVLSGIEYTATVQALSKITSDYTSSIESNLCAATIAATIPISGSKAITSFTIGAVTGTINSDNTITAEMPYGTDLTALKPTITVSDKASVSPSSASETDFTDPVEYTVTAEDNTTRVYTVTVTVSASPDLVIGSQKFGTWAQAAAAAETGDTIVLMHDVTMLSGDTMPSVACTIDGGQSQYTLTSVRDLDLKADITLKDLKLHYSGSHAYAGLYSYDDVNVCNITISGIVDASNTSFEGLGELHIAGTLTAYFIQGFNQLTVVSGANLNTSAADWIQNAKIDGTVTCGILSLTNDGNSSSTGSGLLSGNGKILFTAVGDGGNLWLSNVLIDSSALIKLDAIGYTPSAGDIVVSSDNNPTGLPTPPPLENINRFTLGSGFAGFKLSGTSGSESYDYSLVASTTAPDRRSGVAATTSAGVTVNSAYTLNLLNIFEDAENDALTFKVSVNGASYVAANTDYSYTPTAAGTTTLEFKANDSTADSTDTYKVTLTAASAPVNPGSGGGGGTISTPTVTTSSTGMGSSTVTTVSASISGTISGGTQTVSIQKDIMEALTAATEKVKAAGEQVITSVNAGSGSGLDSVGIMIPGTQFRSFASDTSVPFRIDTGLGSVTFPSDVVDTIGAAGSGDVSFGIGVVSVSSLSAAQQKAVSDRPVYSFSVTVGSTAVTQLGGSVVVSIPYILGANENPNAVVVYYLDASGNLQSMQGKYDAAAKSVTFATSHFSDYVIGYNKVSFTDVSSSTWYANAVTFLAARGITSGTSDGSFSPNAKLTRGQFITMLLHAYGISADANPTNNFADAGDTYYTGYLAAARKFGITNGVGNNKFAPDQAITRQEMFTLLYNALKALDKTPTGNSGKGISDFSDAGNIASWATDAMTALVSVGTVTGDSGKLNPTGTTTRAEMAQVLYNLLGK